MNFIWCSKIIIWLGIGFYLNYLPQAFGTIVIYEPHFSMGTGSDESGILTYKTTTIAEATLFPIEIEDEINQGEFLETSIDHEPLSPVDNNSEKETPSCSIAV